MSLFPLITQMKKKNADAQRIFFYKFQKKMFSLCQRYISIDAIAEEVMVDGFERFFEVVQEFTYLTDGTVVLFLRRIMINESVNYVTRVKKNYAVEPLEEADEETVDETVTTWISTQEIYQLIERLPEDYRIIFCLYALDDYSHNEIGNMLNITSQLSAVKFQRARKLLRELIIKNYNYDGSKKNK